MDRPAQAPRAILTRIVSVRIAIYVLADRIGGISSRVGEARTPRVGQAAIDHCEHGSSMAGLRRGVEQCRVNGGGLIPNARPVYATQPTR